MSYPKATTNPDGQGDDTGKIPSSPRFAEVEERVLAFWKDDDTFNASVERNPAGDNGSNEYVFYDGPPFANGLPHYGHLLTGYVKDIVPRFQTMRGRHVERRFGWDTHGLPAELEAMSQLGIKTRDEILEMGIDKFNAAAKASVLRYTEDWKSYVTRQARWVDFDNDYKTLDPSYMESVLWAFKTLYDKGLVYEGFRVLPYCWNDQTPLSSHELRMDDDVYQIRRDPSVTVGFRLETGELALIWTTTPWTLPSNLAIMVHPDVDYLVVESDVTGTTERYVIAADRLDAYLRELGEDAADHIVQRLKGTDLVGRSYTPPFSYYAGHRNAHTIVPAEEFVTTTEGTGLVHSAGAFGEEDKIVTDRNDIEPVVPVAADGTFTAPVTDYQGVHVFDANTLIIEHLKHRTEQEPPEPVEGPGSNSDALRQAQGSSGGAATVASADVGSTTPGTVLLRQEMYDHSYPHCWRCRQPLIYMGVSSWFVEVTKFKDRMGELNQQINWVPEHVKDGQFGKWLAGARDWSISRNRFWGSPIPVWRSDDPTYPRTDVYGSIAELEADFGVTVTDLHRPMIDDLVRPNPDDPTGRSMMRRVPDVLDVWFDSGSMPYAQVHYPHQNSDWFEHHYPGDFIVEYIGQTRGWFYTMHVLATALFDRPAFQNCLSHGIVLGNDGQKMSKSLRNYPDVAEVFDRDGADAMRWFLMSSPILRGGNLIVTEQGIREGVRQVIIPLWNAWYFFSLYANSANGGAGYDAVRSTESTDVLDRYILAKLRQTVTKVGDALEELEIAVACDEVRWFGEVLSNWYIRRSRERFWDGESAESRQAFDTLYTVLETLTRVAAPLLPLITEEVWRGLTGGRSVHLTDWPDAGRLPADDDLVARMDRVREVCSAASALRKAKQLRTRLPLSTLRVVTDDAAALQPFAGLIADELNVRTIELVELADAGDDLGVRQELQVNARAAGPRLGKDVQAAIKASKSGDWSVGDDGVVRAGGIALQEGEFTLRTAVGGEDREDRAVAMLPGSGFVILNTEVTAELAAEGAARDVIRAVQQARRDAGLEISDRIGLTLVPGDDDLRSAIEAHRELIAAETLAETVALGKDQPADTADLGGGRKVGVRVAKIN
ncbi:isoleucine--tRNA ligase [Microlunatus soli]|uniref:Isoleucine--tRNA ligase n=1 Tax=Microlunatus soli TaxID=630515 RepID=A0A1H1R9Y7_9ACTN|nr:isoleucine--tRNA ligase [Microlunatus soli]SDS32508.1 Isoleucyl-tRNA synthetase [Microlunatus soli]